MNIKTFDNVLAELFNDESDIRKMKEKAKNENVKMENEFAEIKSSGKRYKKTSLAINQLDDLLKLKKQLTQK